MQVRAAREKGTYIRIDKANDIELLAMMRFIKL